MVNSRLIVTIYMKSFEGEKFCCFHTFMKNASHNMKFLYETIKIVSMKHGTENTNLSTLSFQSMQPQYFFPRMFMHTLACLGRF